MTLTQRNKDAAMNVLALIANADGYSDPNEQMLILGYCRIHGISNEDLEAWQPSEFWKDDIPTQRDERRGMLLAGISVMMADGQIHMGEELICKELASLLGYDPDVVEAVVDCLCKQMEGDFQNNPSLLIEQYWLGDAGAKDRRKEEEQKFLNSIGIGGCDSVDDFANMFGQLTDQVRGSMTPQGQEFADEVLRGLRTGK